jgi:hypothetical protein
MKSMIQAAVLLVFLAGCRDSYQPAKRELPAQPAPEISQPAPAAEGAAEPSGSTVDLGTILLSAPHTWVRKPPRSQFISAEFALPGGAADAEQGRLTVSVAGGSIEANVDRWRGQFEDKLAEDSQEELEIAGATVTLVDFSGTYNDQPGPFAAGVKREGYRMMAARISAVWCGGSAARAPSRPTSDGPTGKSSTSGERWRTLLSSA